MGAATMAKRSRLKTSALRLVTAPRIHIRAHKIRSPRVDDLPPVRLRPGMNEPESRIAQALDELKINYTAQTELSGGNVLGGARADFLLTDYRIDLEFSGPYHSTAYGTGRDLLRNLGVARQGYRVVKLYDRDLPRLKPRILEVIGQPL